MLQAAKLVEEFTKETDFAEFKDSELISAAVEREIEIIGEVAKNISREIRTQYPEMDWKGIAGMRDIVAHAYRKVQKEELWSTIREDVPLLIEQLERILGDLERENRK